MLKCFIHDSLHSSTCSHCRLTLLKLPFFAFQDFHGENSSSFALMTRRRINSIFNDITTLSLLTALLSQQLNYSQHSPNGLALNISFFFFAVSAKNSSVMKAVTCESLSMNLSCYMPLLEKQFKHENRVKNCATISL